MKENYHKIMMNEIERNTNENRRPKILLHSCCGPCSSYVIKFLSEYFDMEILFFNPNIYPKDEYMKRLEEQIELVKNMNFNYKVIGQNIKVKFFMKQLKGVKS